MEEKFLPQIFEHEEFGKIRVVMIDGVPWFVGKDVATALGYKEPEKAVRKHVPDKYKGVSVLDTPRGKQKVVVINEAGMYKLVMRSKLEKAEEFSDWVCEDVLISIRKTGSYSVAPADETIDPITAASIDSLAQAISEHNAVERERLAFEREKIAFAREKFKFERNTSLVQAFLELVAAERENFNSERNNLLEQAFLKLVAAERARINLERLRAK